MVAALMATTCLTPSKASAEPVTAFITGLGIAFGGGAAAGTVAGLAGGALGAGYATGAFLATGIGSTLLSLGLSAVAAKLNQPQQAAPSVRMQNFSQPISYAEWVFGRTRKGGPLGFTGFKSGDDVVTGQSGAKRHYSPILAMHQSKGIVEHWLDESIVEVDEDGTRTSDVQRTYYRIRAFDGKPGQVADAELVAQFPEITEDFKFLGLTGAHIWARRPRDEDFNRVYPQGKQAVYAPVLDGYDQVYDPRDEAHKWTQNAALNIAAIVDVIWGQGTDDELVAIEADHAEMQVAKRGGGLQDRWQINGTISDEMDFGSQQAMIMAAADVFFYELPSGNVGFKLGRWEEPAIVLRDEDFLSVELRTGSAKLGSASEVALRYVEPDNNWKESVSATVSVNDDAILNRSEPEGYLVTNHNQAFRVARRLAALESPDFTLRGTLKPIGRFLRGERFVTIALAGWPEFTLEVGKLTSNGGVTYDVEGVSTKEDDHAPDVSLIEPQRPEYQEVASDNTVPDLTGFSGTTQADGSIRYTWTEPDDESLNQRLRYRKTGDLDWQLVSIEAGQVSVVINGLGDATIEAQGQNLTGTKRTSGWSPDPADLTDSIANPIAPAALVSFTATVSVSDVDIDLQAPNDAEYRGTRIYRADYAGGYLGGFDIDDATLIQTEYGATNATDTWTDTALAAGVHAYWGIPINSSGKRGPTFGPVSVETF